MGVKIVLPKEAKGAFFATPMGTKIYIDDVEIKEVTTFGIPQVGADGVIEVCITLPLSEICYAEE